ncbi:MAG: Na+/H+ antiporter NhaA [Xanthomonadales bacterium]|nr:Na+/H+ antiporter NhaA [Xanthomonadales bacterium]
MIAATVLALVIANIPAAQVVYQWILGLHLTITIGGLGVDKPLLLWTNDALMVFFFMLVGLELKREVVEGQLSRPDQMILPIMAALGGLVVPAVIYWALNGDIPGQKNGWAIPTATDIAFALAMLGLLGSRVPISLKVFLTTIAIVDDIAAIVIIAVFYSSDLSLVSLGLAGLGIAVLFVLNRMKVMRLAPYMLTALFIWLCVLKSGVHATLAGVVVAAFIPLKSGDSESPARHLEHALHPWVAFAVLPIFAFANAGVSFYGMSLEKLSNGVPMGIILGLVFGKQLGVFGMVALARLLRIAKLPSGATWGQVYGVALLCGIGFTMSLFIGTLAFEHGDFNVLSGVKMGVLVGSVLSAIAGLLVLHLALPKGAVR